MPLLPYCQVQEGTKKKNESDSRYLTADIWQQLNFHFQVYINKFGSISHTTKQQIILQWIILQQIILQQIILQWIILQRIILQRIILQQLILQQINLRSSLYNLSPLYLTVSIYHDGLKSEGVKLLSFRVWHHL